MNISKGLMDELVAVVRAWQGSSDDRIAIETLSEWYDALGEDEWSMVEIIAHAKRLKLSGIGALGWIEQMIAARVAAGRKA